jgi:hypothetical protein
VSIFLNLIVLLQPPRRLADRGGPRLNPGVPEPGLDLRQRLFGLPRLDASALSYVKRNKNAIGFSPIAFFDAKRLLAIITSFPVEFAFISEFYRVAS